MRFGVLIFMVAIALVACNGSDASCSICNRSFTNAECMTLATSQGCASGEPYNDTICQPPTQGCRFHGCPTGGVLCSPSGASADAGH